MGDEMQYGYVMPLFPIPPMVGIIAQILLAIELRQLSAAAWVVAPAWIGAGALIYYVYGRHHVVQTRDEIVTLKEAPPPSERAFRILVPLANPDNALRMLSQTLRIAEAKNAQVDLLHMVPVPAQIPLSDAGQYTDAGDEAIAEALLYMASRFPVSHTVRYCRNPARGIVAAARERNVDLIIMGWRGRSQRRDFLFGSTVDPVLERSHCDVVLLRDCTQRSYHSILVPFAGGPNSLLALVTASMLVDPRDGIIVPFNVASPGDATIDMEAFLKKHEQLFHCWIGRFNPKYEVAKNVRESLVNEAAHHDLTVIGASGHRGLQQFALGSVPEFLAENTDLPMVMVRARTAVASLVNRWL